MHSCRFSTRMHLCRALLAHMHTRLVRFIHKMHIAFGFFVLATTTTAATSRTDDNHASLNNNVFFQIYSSAFPRDIIPKVSGGLQSLIQKTSRNYNRYTKKKTQPLCLLSPFVDIAPAMGKFEAVCEYFMMFLFVRATKNQFRLSARACVVEFFLFYTHANIALSIFLW